MMEITHNIHKQINTNSKFYQSPKIVNVGFERSKAEVMSEILKFHHQTYRVRSNTLTQKAEFPQIMNQIKMCKKGGLTQKGQYLNEYILNAKTTDKLLPSKSSTQANYQIIDHFIKKNTSFQANPQVQIPSHPFQITRKSMANKSFNESSTMTLTKQISPQRKIRKMQKVNTSESKRKSNSVSQYESCPLSVSNNECSQRNTQREQAKKGDVSLPTIERAMQKQEAQDSLERIEEYDQLLDCNFEEGEGQFEETQLLSYLKNKIKLATKGKENNKKPVKQKKNTKSFNKENKKTEEIVNESIKKDQFQQQNLSTVFFNNHNSRPSTVQKISDKSNEKSDTFLAHLEEYHPVDLFNKPQVEKQILPSELHLSHNEGKPKLNKKIQINLEDFCSSKEDSFNFNAIASSRFDQSASHPSVPSFRMKHQPKKIQIQLFPSQQHSLNKTNLQDEVDLSALSNYQSQGEVKPQEKQLIDSLRQHVNNLKQKISSNLKPNPNLNNTSQLRSDSVISQDFSKELLSDFTNLKRKMLVDVGQQLD